MIPEPTHRQVMLNGRLLASGDASIPSFAAGSQAGDGVFETIKVLGGRPVFFTDHCARLVHGVRALGLGCAPKPAELRARCHEVLVANATLEGVLQVTVYAARPDASELIVTSGSRYSPADFARGFRLKTARSVPCNSHFVRLKTIRQRAVYQRARRAAQAAGGDEALLVDPAGIVLEGSVSNFFLVRHGRILTPALTSGILPGIVRAQLLLASGLPPIEESIVPEHFVGDTTEAFLTNSLLGVMPVAWIDGYKYDVGRNPVTRAVIAAYQRLEAADIAGGA